VLLWFFCFCFRVKLKPLQRTPALVAFGAIACLLLARWINPEVCERLERMTFDMRARAALRFPSTVATNLGFVFINEESVRRVRDGSLGLRFGLYWPRQVYGRLVNELAVEGANAAALDIIFGELRVDHPSVLMADGFPGPESDVFFATEMERARNVIIAITPEVTPPPLFLTNAAAVGDIFAEKDVDGVLRRACAFRIYRQWHPAFRQMEADPSFGVDLHRVRVEPRQVVLPRAGLEEIRVPLDPDGNFDLADFVGDQIPPGMARKSKPFTTERIWHMGLVLAARHLGLDLDQAEVDLGHGRITLHGPAGLQRVIPVDGDGYFFIDWCLPENDERLLQEPIQNLLARYKQRLEDQTNGPANAWRDRLVVVGSSGLVGNNLTDRGVTPLRADTLLAAEHWNVASSLMTGRFVRRAPLALDLVLITFLGIIAAILTCELRVLTASVVMVLVWGLYSFGAVLGYLEARYWLPLFLPLFGSLVTHLSLVTWRVVFEQAERRRVRSIFSTIVSPKIVNDLLQAKTLSLEGARREVTVMFADIRGFTELADLSQQHVTEFVRTHHLQGAAAEACFDEQARHTLETVNVYLSRVADTVIGQDGTLDKFIGDCVMAFWGAPTPNPQHAVACVRAAIQAQRAIFDLNEERRAENQRREHTNPSRLAAGLSPARLLPILFLGTGINTGMAAVGLMGSESKTLVRQRSYTVFGSEVNLASRLEGASGRGHIFISKSTYDHLRRDDPALAATCYPLPNLLVLKGIRDPVCVYEVSWHPSGVHPIPEDPVSASGAVQPPVHPNRLV